MGTPFTLKFDLNQIEWWTAQLNDSLNEQTILYFKIENSKEPFFVERKEIMETICELVMKKKRFKNITGYLRYCLKQK